VAFLLPDSGQDHEPQAGIALATTATLFYVLLVLTVGTQVFANWLDKRSAKQLPQGPARGAGGQASPGLPSGGPRRQHPPAGHGRHTAEAARRRRPRPSLLGSPSLRPWSPAVPRRARTWGFISLADNGRAHAYPVLSGGPVAPAMTAAPTDSRRQDRPGRARPERPVPRFPDESGAMGRANGGNKVNVQVRQGRW